MKVIIIGGGWAGTSAAISAKKAGAEVELYEKTDLLLGLGNVGGIMRNNGRYTATEELIALGVEDIFSIIDSCCIHKNIDFPGHKHAYLYNVTKIFDSFVALDNLSLNVEKGSIYGLVGPNGSGKTTIMKAIAGIYKVDSGEIFINDKKSFENIEVGF